MGTRKEIDFLKDKGNIEAFAKELYGDNPTPEQLAEAETYLAKGGISLVDSSYSKVVGGQDADANSFNENVSKAEDFIQENFGDSSTFNYKDGNGNIVITHGFQATEEERDDRYGNLEGFNDNQDFYKENLNFNTGKVGNASDYAKGGVDAVGNVVDAIKSDFIGVAKEALESALHPIDSGLDTGKALGEVNAKIDLDEMMGDDASANEHRGARDLAIATAILPATGKIVKVGGKYYSKLKNGKTVEIPEAEALKSLEVDGKKSHNKDLHDKINNKDRQAVLRTDYEREVSTVLKKEIDTMKQSGKYTDEEIARYGNERRLEIGEKYKDLTPKELQETVFERNSEKYENKWGPSYEFLKRKGCKGKPCTDAQIIEKVTRPGGEEFKKNGGFDKPELKWRKYKDE